MYALHPTRFQPEQPTWRDFKHYRQPQLPTGARDWLLDQGSLTQRLIRASGGRFQVQLLDQRWRRPRPDEARLLGMAPREAAIVREVALLCNGEPWVFARSVLPASSLTGPLRRFARLDSRPLGALLFKDPSMRRYPFELARFAGDSPQLPAALRQPQAIWGRRCRFELRGKPVMVSELFLPAFRA